MAYLIFILVLDYYITKDFIAICTQVDHIWHYFLKMVTWGLGFWHGWVELLSLVVEVWCFDGGIAEVRQPGDSAAPQYLRSGVLFHGYKGSACADGDPHSLTDIICIENC